MAQTEPVKENKFEVECRKCTNTVILDEDPGENFKCPVCDPSNFKSMTRKVSRCANHPHYAWIGFGDCERCQIDKLKRRLGRKEDPEFVLASKTNQIKESDASIAQVIESKRQKRLEREAKATQASIETNELSKQILKTLKEINEVLRK